MRNLAFFEVVEYQKEVCQQAATFFRNFAMSATLSAQKTFPDHEGMTMFQGLKNKGM
jgi:hypothetical protein